MLLLVQWEFTPEDREKVYDRFREAANTPIPGIEGLGRWHVVGRGAGVAVVKAENEEAAARLALVWSNVTSMRIEPILDDETYARVIG